MAASLRERRRQQTELDIQRATISLALEQGLDHVTTEAIADRAGISPRTFFNYYPNKEAAVVGHPPDFPDCAREAFVTGQGNLRDDLRILLMSNLRQMENRPDIIRGIGELWKENARVRWMLELEIEKLIDVVADCIQRRQPDMAPGLRHGLADWTMRSSHLAIGLWAQDKADDLETALDIVWEEQLEVARCLLG